MIPLFKVHMSSTVANEIVPTLYSGWIGQGPKVAEFETALSRQFHNPRVLGLSAGTHGLHLALHMAGVVPGDYVITTPLTCTATNWPILYQGANILWADVQKDTLNIDPVSVTKLANSGLPVKAIIAMHWGGYPCDLAELRLAANSMNASLIEDAAHAFGSRYGQMNIGHCEFSDFTMFSFQAIKLLTCGDGGALVCKSEESYKRGKLLRWYGIDRETNRKDMRCEENIIEWGWKYHMNDIAATIGLENIKDLKNLLSTNTENAFRYDMDLQDIDGLTLIQRGTDRQSSNWLYTILVENRDDFTRWMTECQIHVSRVHERNDIHSCVFNYKTELPVLDEVVPKMVCIPVGWWVAKDDREYIVECIKKGW